MSKDYSKSFAPPPPSRTFRQVRGFTTEINRSKQGRHIPGSRNYEIGRSPLSISFQEAQYLIEHYAGAKGWVGRNRQFVNFGFKIGTWINEATSRSYDTTRGQIHYSKTGAHLVPAPPQWWLNFQKKGSKQ